MPTQVEAILLNTLCNIYIYVCDLYCNLFLCYRTTFYLYVRNTVYLTSLDSLSDYTKKYKFGVRLFKPNKDFKTSSVIPINMCDMHRDYYYPSKM